MGWDLETNTRFHPAIVWKRKKQHPIYVIAVMLGYAIFRMTNNTKKNNSSSSNNINMQLGAMTNKYDHREYHGWWGVSRNSWLTSGMKQSLLPRLSPITKQKSGRLLSMIYPLYIYMCVNMKQWSFTACMCIYLYNIINHLEYHNLYLSWYDNHICFFFFYMYI